MARIGTTALLLALAACGSSQEKAQKAATRFDTYYARGDHYSARVEIKRAIAAQDDVPEYWSRLARVELASGRYLEAYQAYLHVTELNPTDEEAIQAMAELSYAGNRFDEAERLADQMLEKQPRLLRMLLVKGSVKASVREPERARAIAEQMLAIDPGNEGAKLLLARAMNMTGQREEAIGLLNRAVAEEGESIAKLMVLLDLYMGSDDFPRTARTFARLFILQPLSIDLRLEFARVLYQHGRPQAALGMLARLTRVHAHDPSLTQPIVDLWSDVGAAAVDVDRVRRFVATSGNDQLKIALGQLLLDERRFAEAEAVLRPFIDRGEISAEKVSADVLYAGALSGMRRHAAAGALIDRILKFDESNPRALLMRVSISIARGDLAGALRDAQTLTRDNPDLTEGRVALAKIYVLRREKILADAAYASAMKDLPADSAMLSHYIAYLLDTGRAPAALDATKRFSRENPRSRDGWRERAGLCLRLGDQACLKESVFMLEQIPGGLKVVRTLLGAQARPATVPDAAPPPAPAAGQAPPNCGRTGASC